MVVMVKVMEEGKGEDVKVSVTTRTGVERFMETGEKSSALRIVDDSIYFKYIFALHNTNDLLLIIIFVRFNDASLRQTNC